MAVKETRTCDRCKRGGGRTRGMYRVEMVAEKDRQPNLPGIEPAEPDSWAWDLCGDCLELVTKTATTQRNKKGPTK